MMDKRLQKMEALLREKDSLNVRAQELNNDKSLLASNMDYLHWLENKEKVKNVHLHQRKVTMEKERLSILQQMIEREEKVLNRDLEHLSLKEDWFKEEAEKEQDPPKEQPLVEDDSMSKEEAERKAFKAEKANMNKERESFLTELDMISEAYNKQQDRIMIQREDFQAEVEEMGLMRKAYLKERTGIEKMRRSFLMEKEKTLKETEEMEEMRRSFLREKENMLDEIRKSFQAMKDTISKEREAFKKEMVAKRMIRKAFNAEKESMEQEREDFKIEVEEMGMRRKVYLREKLGMEKTMESFHKEMEKIKTEGERMNGDRPTKNGGKKPMATKPHKAKTVKPHVTAITIFNSACASGDTNCSDDGIPGWNYVCYSVSQEKKVNRYWPETVWRCKDGRGNCGCRRR